MTFIIIGLALVLVAILGTFFSVVAGIVTEREGWAIPAILAWLCYPVGVILVVLGVCLELFT